MNEKNDCKIVQDLLPNYMEGLTDKETNEFIEQHLKKCKDCKKVYESLKEKPKNLEISENGKKVDYFKKYKRRMTQLKVILFIILYILFLVLWRRMLILIMVSQKAEKNQQSDNYYVKYTQYSCDEIIIVETYRKGEKSLTISSGYNYKTKNTEYNDYISMNFYNGENKMMNVYSEGNGKKTARLNVERTEEYFLPGEIERGWIYDGLYQAYSQVKMQNAWTFFINIFQCSIRTVKCNGRKCYYFSNFKEFPGAGHDIYIDKENGLPVRVPGGTVTTLYHGTTDSIKDYDIYFDIVTDDDLIEPDISEYEIIENP